MSNGLDPNQAQHSVWPNLGPNCLQDYQQTTNFAAGRERVKEVQFIYTIFK